MDQVEDVAAMLAASAGRFLGQHHSPARARERKASRDGGDSAFWAAMAEQGWLGLRLPEACGGLGLPLDVCVGLLHEFGRAAVPDPFIDGAILPGALLGGLADRSKTVKLGEAVAAGSVRLGFAWQARLGQIAPEASIHASVAADGVHITGEVIQVSQPANQLLVLGELNGEPALFYVPDAAELCWKETRASDGSVWAATMFQNHSGQLLQTGPDVLTVAASALAEAALASAAVMGGIAEKALDLTIAYTKQRRQFDTTLSALQVVQHRLVDLRMQVSLAAASLRAALRLHRHVPGTLEATLAISAAKARASETALLVTRGAVQLHGAMGYTEEAEIGIYLRAAVRHAAAYGNASANRARVLALWPQEQSA